MPLPEGILAADQPAGPTPVFFHYEEHLAKAFVVTAASTGAIVCVPRAGLPQDVFQEAEDQGFGGVIGPSTSVSVAASVSEGRPSRRQLQVTLFDLEMSGFGSLLLEPPEGLEDSVVSFGQYRGVQDAPHVPQMIDLAMQFIQSGRQTGSILLRSRGARGSHSSRSIHKQPKYCRASSSAASHPVTQQAVAGMQTEMRCLPELRSRLQALERGRPLPQSHRSAPAPQLFEDQPQPLPTARLERLQQLAGRGPRRVEDLGRQAKAKADKAIARPTAIIEEEEEADVETELADLGQTTVLERLLISQGQLREKLANAKAAQHDPLSLLTGASYGDSDDVSKAPGVKGIAARQLLVDQFKKHPQKVVSVFKDRLILARRKSSQSELEPRDLWYHMQESVPLGSHRTLTYVAFQAAAMYEAAERQDWDRVRTLIALQAVFAEQAAHDGGSLRLAHLLTGLEDPPFAQTQLHTAAKSELAQGQLSDPRWLAAQLAFLKDVESISEKTHKFTKGATSSAQSSTEDQHEEAWRAKPKWRPQKKKKGTQEPSGNQDA